MDGGQERGRRHILKILTVGGVATALVMPASWTTPLVKSVIVPAHAQASPQGEPTTTSAPTTTPNPTTTVLVTTTPSSPTTVLVTTPSPT